MQLGHSLRSIHALSPGTVRISRVRLAIFTMPVLLFQAIEMAWRAYLPRFLTLDVGMTLGVVGALMLGARLLDAVADPLLGWVSDTVRTPLGLRRPWMLAGALLVPLGALLLFLAPPGTGLVRIVGASLLLHLGYSLIITPHGGWGLELSDDSHQRTRIMGAKVWFGLLGSLGLIALMAPGHPAHRPDGAARLGDRTARAHHGAGRHRHVSGAPGPWFPRNPPAKAAGPVRAHPA